MPKGDYRRLLKQRQFIQLFTVPPENSICIGIEFGRAEVGEEEAVLTYNTHDCSVSVRYKNRRAYIPMSDYVRAACEAIELKLKKKAKASKTQKKRNKGKGK